MDNFPFSSRLLLLWNLSFENEGLEIKKISNSEQQLVSCLFPRHFVERVFSLSHEKSYDYCFRGALKGDQVTEDNRRWILKFVGQRFSVDSYFQATDSASLRGPRIARGAFDYTFRKSGFVPKENPRQQRAHFDEEYFSVMCASQFTLCPAGDAPWSMRFFEAILSGSLPIVETFEHTGRNETERQLGYTYFLSEAAEFKFSPIFVKRNLEIFLTKQTLLHGENR